MFVLLSVLRLAVLFLNVYETFKTLKPSKRNSEQLSARASYKRKREMKGCLSVWVVWCFLAAYERLLDGMLCLVVPFHDEVKSVIMFFLLVTRARGAEPIFLHIIRPLVKPYTETVDAILDLARMFGDLSFFLVTAPLRFLKTWWQTRTARFDKKATSNDSGLSLDQIRERVAAPAVGRPTHSRAATDPVSKRTHLKPRQHSDTRLTGGSLRVRHSSTDTSTDSQKRAVPLATDRPGIQGRVVYGRGSQTSLRSGNRSAAAPTVAQHQIWYPPAAAYAEHQLEPPTNDVPTLPKDPPSTPPTTQLLPTQPDEWYPPFPAAYPPTPSVATLPLLPISGSNAGPAASGTRVHVGLTSFPPIPEGQETPALFSDDPGSDNRKANGAGPSSVLSPLNETDGNEGDVENEEDDFDVTLRTPLHLAAARRARIRESPSRPSSASSSQSRSTTLTTIDDGSSMRTNSSNSSESSVSDSSTPVRSTLRAKAPSPPERVVPSMISSSTSNDLDHPKAATWSSRTRTPRMGARGVFTETVNAEPRRDIETDTEEEVESAQAHNNHLRDNKKGRSVAPARVPATIGGRRHEHARPTRARDKAVTVPAPASTKVQAHTGGSRTLRSASSRPVAGSASQDSGTATSRSTLPRSTRTRK